LLRRPGPTADTRAYPFRESPSIAGDAAMHDTGDSVASQFESYCRLPRNSMSGLGARMTIVLTEDRHFLDTPSSISLADRRSDHYHRTGVLFGSK
jgi:hypothetical protein